MDSTALLSWASFASLPRPSTALSGLALAESFLELLSELPASWEPFSEYAESSVENGSELVIRVRHIVNL